MTNWLILPYRWQETHATGLEEGSFKSDYKHADLMGICCAVEYKMGERRGADVTCKSPAGSNNITLDTTEVTSCDTEGKSPPKPESGKLATATERCCLSWHLRLFLGNLSTALGYGADSVKIAHYRVLRMGL